MNVENIDFNEVNLFAYATNLTQIFDTVGNLENNNAIGTDGVSAEVLKISLPVIVFVSTPFNILSLSRGRFAKILKDAEGCHLHMSGNILNVINYRSISILPASGKVFEKIM